ncbi:MAG: hypothetical protein ACM3SW_17325 [Actinomycetota bacterium]
MLSYLHVQLEDAELKDILDRVLDGCITFDPWVRIRLSSLEVNRTGERIIVAPERRRKPFVVPRQQRSDSS